MKKRLIPAAALAILALYLILRMRADVDGSDLGISQRLFGASLSKGLLLCNSFVPYGNSDWEELDFAESFWSKAWETVPIAELASAEFVQYPYLYDYMQEGEGGAASLEEAGIAENEAAAEAGNEISLQQPAEESYFVPVSEPQAVYSRQQLQDEEFIKETFYSVDPTTMVREGQLDFDTLMGFDATLKQDNSEPQILVYHTHSQEAYIDSVPNDDSTSIMGVGEHLCEILRTKYGYNVLHHMGKYDVESRDYAYSNAMADIESVLEQNPSIEVIIDLHRDETNADTRLVTTIQGMEMAKFMFFNGLSYTRELGELTGLQNPYIQDNLSFAFQMQLFAEEYYPGLTRRIYLKGYRYNMHYRPKTLLIELGSQTNTVEEAMNSCEPLAYIISEVLSGANKQ